MAGHARCLGMKRNEYMDLGELEGKGPLGRPRNKRRILNQS
jgi:hypothetical protein